jgi:inosine-uridine nucleoside N-ribohydrolase
MDIFSNKILIDTDPGIGVSGADIDDGIAILLALASPKLDIIGITTVFGNVPCNSGTRNLLNLLLKINMPQIPVAQGAVVPIGRRLQTLIDRDRPEEYRELEPNYSALLQHEQGPDYIVHMAEKYRSALSVAAVGPLTNLALALVKEPHIMEKIKEIVIMGGSASIGNITPVAEFNILQDPEAADIVFRSGIPITMVGLDVTMQVRFNPSMIAKWDCKASPVLQFLYEVTLNWMKYRHEVHNESDIGCYLHDAMVIAYLLDYTLFTTVSCHVDVELHGTFTRGMTIADRRIVPEGSPNVKLVTKIDGDRFIKMIIDNIYNKWCKMI